MTVSLKVVWLSLVHIHTYVWYAPVFPTIQKHVLFCFSKILKKITNEKEESLEETIELCNLFWCTVLISVINVLL